MAEGDQLQDKHHSRNSNSSKVGCTCRPCPRAVVLGMVVCRIRPNAETNPMGDTGGQASRYPRKPRGRS